MGGVARIHDNRTQALQGYQTFAGAVVAGMRNQPELLVYKPELALLLLHFRWRDLNFTSQRAIFQSVYCFIEVVSCWAYI